MKIFKKILLGLVVLTGIGVTIIYFYKDTLIKKYVDEFNDSYNVTISYADTDLSLFKKFPNASVGIKQFSVVNDTNKDTLFVSSEMSLTVNIKDLFKNREEKIILKDILVNDAKLSLLIEKDGSTNFDIKELDTVISKEEEISTESAPFNISIEKYTIENSTIVFNDKQSEMYVEVQNLNHSGKGDFSASTMDLDTKTTIEALTVALGKIKYFNKTQISLDAILGMDLDKMKFTFKENNAKINDLDLKFDGFVQMNDTSQEYDISFSTPKANFKSILSLVPSAYSSDFSGVSATGIANVNGVFKGVLSDTEFPKYDVHISTSNASFQYPDLPKSVTNIDFDGRIASITTNNDVFLAIKKLQFTIDKDHFAANGKITHLTTNPTIDAAFKGTLNLENLTKAYPIAMEEKLEGILKANFTTQANQKAIENNQFDKIKTNGTASLDGFSYAGDDMANPLEIKNAAIKFNTNSIMLSNFSAKTGKSDIQASGKLDNLYAFLFNEKDLKGNFNVNATNFEISDFLVEEEVTTTKEGSENTEVEALKIPAFLDINTNFTAKRVVYDNLILKNVSGLVSIKNQKVILRNTKATMLDGKITMNGDISTQTIPATFDLDMDIEKFDIAKSFSTLETFQKIAPIAKALKGKYTTKFKLKGNLDNEFSPEMNSLSGNAFAQLLVKSMDEKASPLLNTLASKIDFIDLDKINLDKIKAAFSFENGKVSVKPFDIKHKDITMQVSGSHGFDTSMDYNMVMDVPAKYLGKDAVNLLAKLGNMNKDTIKVPLSTIIKGTLTKPSVKVNVKQAISQLTTKVVAYQKQKLTNQATDKVTSVISGLINKNSSKKDSTSTKGSANDKVKEGVSSLINLFGKKKKK